MKRLAFLAVAIAVVAAPTTGRTAVPAFLAASGLAPTNSAKAEDAQCTIKLEACGGLEQNLSPLTKIKEGVCMKVDLVTIGKKPNGVYYSALVWIGVNVSGDTLVFGTGEAKSGVALECSWNSAKPKPQQQLDSLKASIPELLKNEQFQKQFPGIKNIDVSKLKSIGIADDKCAKALVEFAKKK
jgi:hypothetical protein